MRAPDSPREMITSSKNGAAQKAKLQQEGVRRVSEWLEELLPHEERDEEEGGGAPSGKETSVIVNQLSCKEEGCPDVEVVMTLLRAKPRPKLMFKVFKAAADLSREEVQEALQKAMDEEAKENEKECRGHDHHEHGHQSDDHSHGNGEHHDVCCGHDHADGKNAHSHSDGKHEHGHEKHEHDHGDGGHHNGCCDHDHSDGTHEHGHESSHSHGH